ncbi:membrane-associated protein [Thiohalocapsa marina]|uniref:Membrane-associated protein n=1 Tax=Thiohalocapsa marina TaxID=424902 RepID=A0A5M8FKF3_9GAMM|nr:VTT domain-containing protein [Thiohalocapsa marina]KAA6185199.1 membrane-associated protein [Thiohalocapsa marina]
MEGFIQTLLQWVQANPGWAYAAVFLAAFAESLAIVGVMVPGVAIMLGAGALIATDALQFWPACLAAVAGAVLGDGLSYWLGHHYRHRIRHWWPFSRHPRQLDQGMAFFRRHGTKSVVIGRFFGPVRAVVPLVAGMLAMPPSRFVAANVASALAWAPAYLAPGIAFGASLQLAAEAATRLVVLLLVLLGALWFSAWAAKRLFWFFSPRANTWVQALLRWSALHPTLGRIAQALAEPAHPDARTLTGLAGALLLATALFGITLSIGLFGPQELGLNRMVLQLGQSLRTPFADTLMAGLALLASPLVLLGLVVTVFAYLRRLRQRRDSAYWLAASLFVLFATPALGWLLRIPRPAPGANAGFAVDPDVSPDAGLDPGMHPGIGLVLELPWPWSFPSAAVLGATLSYGFLALMLSRGVSGPGRWLPYGIAAGIVACVTLARLYFGAEWLTDILGSIGLGLIWITALGLAFRRHTRQVPPWGGLALVSVLGLGVGLGTSLVLASALRPPADAVAHRARGNVEHISPAQWQARDCSRLPSHRSDLRQRHQRPFRLVYAGDLDALAKALAPSGWGEAERLTPSTALRLLSPSLSMAELPVIPQVHDGQHERLTLVREAGADRRYVLRMWSTDCRIAPDVPVWVGDVTALRKVSIGHFLVLPLTRGDHDRAQGQFEADLRATPELVTGPGQPLLVVGSDSGLLPPERR